MKFVLSEGRVICLLEKEDGSQPITNGNIPKVDLLLIPKHHKDHIEKSHVWSQLLPHVKHGLQNVVYF